MVLHDAGGGEEEEHIKDRCYTCHTLKRRYPTSGGRLLLAQLLHVGH